MFQTHKTFIEINGQLYQVIRQIKESHRPVIEAWKEVLMADKVFKKDESFFFVREVPEAELVIEETTEESKPTTDEQ
jgi:hypothetical protein